jgi:acetyl-CoA synthetase
VLLFFPHDKRERTLWLCNFKRKGEIRNKENLFKEINQYISDPRRPIAKLDKIQFVSGLPKHVLVKLCVEYLEKLLSLTLRYLDITKSEIVDEIKDNKVYKSLLKICRKIFNLFLSFIMNK